MGVESYFYRINRKVDSIEELNKLDEKAVGMPEPLDFKIKEIYDKEGEQGVLNKIFEGKLTSTTDMLFLDFRISLAEDNIDKYNKDYLNELVKTQEIPVVKQTMGYWVRHGDLQRYMSSLYKLRGNTGDINCTNIILSKEDLITLITISKLAIRGEYKPTEIGFNWEDTHPKDWERTIEMLQEILDTTNFDEETIYYYSWW